MHGLINRSVQGFLQDTYGDAVWAAILRKADLPHDGFEPMLSYPPEETTAVLNAAALVLHRPVEGILEDMGTYLVSHPNAQTVRRLLRFGGGSFVDFLHSLGDLPDRARLALPDLNLPRLDLMDMGGGIYRLSCEMLLPGVGHAVVGLLRAMADDYGALVLLDHLGPADAPEEDRVVVQIHLLSQTHAEAKAFHLSQPVAAR